jgi:hypothetical protein
VSHTRNCSVPVQEEATGWNVNGEEGYTSEADGQSLVDEAGYTSEAEEEASSVRQSTRVKQSDRA